uniref:ATP synthase F1 subunit epsilon n=1 Tax=Lynx canadensis TaxID=61383 RepID=A0A667GNX8_LYNCA
PTPGAACRVLVPLPGAASAPALCPARTCLCFLPGEKGEGPCTLESAARRGAVLYSQAHVLTRLKTRPLVTWGHQRCGLRTRALCALDGPSACDLPRGTPSSGPMTGTAEQPSSYIRYSQICAKAVRDALKTEFKANAEKTSGSTVKIVKVKKE